MQLSTILCNLHCSTQFNDQIRRADFHSTPLSFSSHAVTILLLFKSTNTQQMFCGSATLQYYAQWGQNWEMTHHCDCREGGIRRCPQSLLCRLVNRDCSVPSSKFNSGYIHHICLMLIPYDTLRAAQDFERDDWSCTKFPPKNAKCIEPEFNLQTRFNVYVWYISLTWCVCFFF